MVYRAVKEEVSEAPPTLHPYDVALGVLCIQQVPLINVGVV